ncbi:MAG: hypothetical protein CMJ64_24525 [Planctomycetaceae bacterium]|nr:hypothetical protein [Planctomycetaceae bacterium]
MKDGFDVRSGGPIADAQTRTSLLIRIRSNDEDGWRRLVRLYGPLVLQRFTSVPQRFGVASNASGTPSGSAINRPKSGDGIDESLLEELAFDVAATYADGLLSS